MEKLDADAVVTDTEDKQPLHRVLGFTLWVSGALLLLVAGASL